MSIIKSFSVGDGDMFYIDHNSDNFSIIDCCMDDGNKEAITKEIKDKISKKGITRFISTHPDEDHRLQGYKILIHCNQGESRAPTIGLLYIARLGAFEYADFDTSVQKLKEIYPVYMPKRNIFLTVRSLWRDFVQNPVEEVNT